MDLIDLEDESIDAEVMDSESLAVSMDNFRVSQNYLFMLVDLQLLLGSVRSDVSKHCHMHTVFIQQVLPCEK